MGTLKDLYEIIKELKNLAKDYQNQEIAEKVIEIQEGFFDFREELENIKDENRQLKERIKELENKAEDENDLELMPQGYYIKKSEKAQGKDIKYCAACWRNEKKLMPFARSIGVMMQCCNCHTTIR